METVEKNRTCPYRVPKFGAFTLSMDIHGKICGYGYGYGWEISYPRQAWLSWSSTALDYVRNVTVLH